MDLTGNPVVGEPCPKCRRKTIVYNGNYFCTHCNWAMGEADRPHRITIAYLIQERDRALESDDIERANVMRRYLYEFGFDVFHAAERKQADMPKHLSESATLDASVPGGPYQVSWMIDSGDDISPAEAAARAWRQSFNRGSAQPTGEECCVFTIADDDRSVVIDLSEPRFAHLFNTGSQPHDPQWLIEIAIDGSTGSRMVVAEIWAGTSRAAAIDSALSLRGKTVSEAMATSQGYACGMPYSVPVTTTLSGATIVFYDGEATQVDTRIDIDFSKD